MKIPKSPRDFPSLALNMWSLNLDCLLLWEFVVLCVFRHSLKTWFLGLALPPTGPVAFNNSFDLTVPVLPPW